MSSKQATSMEIIKKAKESPNKKTTIQVTYRTLGEIYVLFETYVEKGKIVLYNTPHDAVLSGVLEKFAHIMSVKHNPGTDTRAMEILADAKSMVTRWENKFKNENEEESEEDENQK